MGNVIQPLWAECPMLTRLVIVGYPAMSVVFTLAASAGFDWLVGSLFMASIDSLKQFKLWTLLWGPFFNPLSNGMAFLMILFELYMAMGHFPWNEKELGSTTFLLWMFMINVLTSLVFDAIMFCFAMYHRGTIYEVLYSAQSVHGLWPLVMVCLTLSSLSNPDGFSNFWGLVQIPNRWYPVALTAFFMLINGMRIQWNLIAALVVGYGYVKLGLQRFLPSRTKADRMEQRFCRGGRCGLLGASWVTAASTSAFDVDSQVDRRYANLSDFGGGRSGGQTASSNRGGSSNFTAFAGSGNRLGESTDPAPAPAAPATPAPSTAGTEMAVPQTAPAEP
eukprot:TRINITY_DN51189_c0_g1_i1.p1 TRINITY_DN51189_c0_g1~~TRINITY_DN51189_c0_g1_i1.p1  ORF type:complete len:334 (-),score=55.72 TRINITY_DN51189_c0_g1_i1:41-1042(-)